MEVIAKLKPLIAQALDEDLRELQGHGEDDMLICLQLLRNTGAPRQTVSSLPPQVTVQRCLSCGFAAGFCRCSRPEPG